MQIPPLAITVAAEATRRHAHSGRPDAPTEPWTCRPGSSRPAAGTPCTPASGRDGRPVRHLTALALRRLADRLEMPMTGT